MIPLSVPNISGNEWTYVKECLDTEWVSSAGKYVDRFEKEIARFTGAKYAIACTTGTAALHASLIAAGVEPDDEVIVPALSFIAPINAISYIGANPVFMDCDDYYNLDIEKILDFLKTQTKYKNGVLRNKNSNKRIAAILPVHIFGNAVDLAELISFCKEKNIVIIEDASESLGTRYTSGLLKGAYAGTVGDIGIISFNGNKIITTGGGGMVLTSNSGYAEKIRYLTTQAKDDEVNYIHNEIGFNYRLSNLQAALGVAQLEQLDEFIRIKKKNFSLYREKLEKVEGVKLSGVPVYALNNYWMYALQINCDQKQNQRDLMLNFLDKKGIQTRPVWYLNHLQKPYLKYQSYKIEKAIELHRKTLNIPCSTNLTTTDLNRVVKVIREFAKRM